MLLPLLLLLLPAIMAAPAASAAVSAGGGSVVAPPPAQPRMPMQTLGRSGLVVSRLSFGSWVTFSFQVGVNDAYTLMKAAYARGVNFFDNAEAYARGRSEMIMGEAVARGIAEGVWTRSDLVITTKIFFGAVPEPGTASVNAKGLSRKHVVEGALASLKRLQLDYVDVIYAHRPDPVTPIEETVRAFNHLIDRGLAFYWGTSEWSAAQIAEAAGVADRLGLIAPIAEQPEYNLFTRTRVEAEYEPLYHSRGLGLTTWSPLASGILTGKYSGMKVPEGSRLTIATYKAIAQEKFGRDAWQVAAADEVVAIARDVGCSAAQLAIAWALLNPHVSTVILGATSVAQLEENLDALRFVERITPEVRARLEAVGEGRGAPLFHDRVLQSHRERGTAALANFAAGAGR
jgi:voltage-dependent potassium channel beta subunit